VNIVDIAGTQNAPEPVFSRSSCCTCCWIVVCLQLRTYCAEDSEVTGIMKVI